MCSKVGLTLTVVKLNNVQEHRLQGCSGAPNVEWLNWSQRCSAEGKE